MLVSDKGQVYRHPRASLIASSWLGFSSDLGRVSDLEHVFGLRYACQSPHHPFIDQSPHRSLDDEIVDTLSKEMSRTCGQSINSVCMKICSNSRWRQVWVESTRQVRQCLIATSPTEDDDQLMLHANSPKVVNAPCMVLSCSGKRMWIGSPSARRAAISVAER
jgi:hypothetical protein